MPSHLHNTKLNYLAIIPGYCKNNYFCWGFREEDKSAKNSKFPLSENFHDNSTSLVILTISHARYFNTGKGPDILIPFRLFPLCFITAYLMDYNYHIIRNSSPSRSLLYTPSVITFYTICFTQVYRLDCNNAIIHQIPTMDKVPEYVLIFTTSFLTFNKICFIPIYPLDCNDKYHT